ncbi:hypothetical protein [Bacillus cereus]|uniref:hypothetical protein n=1 Tax=Bacillus cereus TaxID=1396 RepID=UPI001879F42E|nr:hypothetical protein [Bacillus cereus]MBE7123671.1 hypothetical protein [Bacillus cereus]
MNYDKFHQQADTERGEMKYDNMLYGQYLLNQLDYPIENILEDGRPMSETLYQGFCAEYHLIADLYRIGLEGTKPAADFGFDVVSTNFRKALYENNVQETYLYQVKARYVEKKDWNVNIGKRTVQKIFYVHPNEMLKMIMTKNSYLVLYLIKRKMVVSFSIYGYQAINLTTFY